MLIGSLNSLNSLAIIVLHNWQSSLLPYYWYVLSFTVCTVRMCCHFLTIMKSEWVRDVLV